MCHYNRVLGCRTEKNNGADSVELWRKPYTLMDTNGDITASGFTYSVVSLDEDETVYTAQVKPSRKSDKALLEKIIELSMRSIAREENQPEQPDQRGDFRLQDRRALQQ